MNAVISSYSVLFCAAALVAVTAHRAANKPGWERSDLIERLEIVETATSAGDSRSKGSSQHTPEWMSPETAEYLRNHPIFGQSKENRTTPPTVTQQSGGETLNFDTRVGGDGLTDLTISLIRPATTTTTGSPLSSPYEGRENYFDRPPLQYNGPVFVRGYYRSDGTYVRPHTRRRPSR